MLKTIIKDIGYLYSYIYPYSFYQKLLHLYELLYTGWRMRGFLYFGKNSKLEGENHIVGKHLIHIGQGVLIGQGTAITAFEDDKGQNEPKIIIGDNSVLGKNCHLTALKQIEIGINLRTGNNVLISDNSHGNPHNIEHLRMSPDARPLYSKGGIIIGNNVWLGEKVSIMSGVKIGDGAIVGANSVVTHDIPAMSIAVGAPAKVVYKNT